VNKYTHVQIWRARGWSYPHLKARLLKDRRLFFNSALAYLSSRE